MRYFGYYIFQLCFSLCLRHKHHVSGNRACSHHNIMSTLHKVTSPPRLQWGHCSDGHLPLGEWIIMPQHTYMVTASVQIYRVWSSVTDVVFVPGIVFDAGVWALICIFVTSYIYSHFALVGGHSYCCMFITQHDSINRIAYCSVDWRQTVSGEPTKIKIKSESFTVISVFLIYPEM